MKTAETAKPVPSADAANPSRADSESPTMDIQARIGLAMFLTVGFLLGVILLADLFSGLFR